MRRMDRIRRLIGNTEIAIEFLDKVGSHSAGDPRQGTNRSNLGLFLLCRWMMAKAIQVAGGSGCCVGGRHGRYGYRRAAALLRAEG